MNDVGRGRCWGSFEKIWKWLNASEIWYGNTSGCSTVAGKISWPLKSTWVSFNVSLTTVYVEMQQDGQNCSCSRIDSRLVPKWSPDHGESKYTSHIPTGATVRALSCSFICFKIRWSSTWWISEPHGWVGVWALLKMVFESSDWAESATVGRFNTDNGLAKLECE